MAWRGGIPRNPVLVSRRDEELSKVGDDLIHEALGSPNHGVGKGTGGLGEGALWDAVKGFCARTEKMPVLVHEEPADRSPSTARMTVVEILSVVSRAALTDRELRLVMRRNEGVIDMKIAHEMGIPMAAIGPAYERGMAALERAVSTSPLFGLRDCYREDLRRARHRRVSHNRTRTTRTRK